MAISARDFDDIYLDAQNTFRDELTDFLRETFEPVALDAFAQQVRQLPAAMQKQLKASAPRAWQRLFGDDV